MLIGIKSIARESWNLYRNNFKLFAKIVLWLLIPATIYSLIPYLGLTPFILTPINSLLYFASALLGLFISIALTLVALGLFKKEEINLKNIYSLSYSKIISCLWVSVLSFLVAVAAMFVSALPALIAFFARSWLPAQNIVLAIFFVISGILLVVSSVILAVWLSFSFYVVVFDNIKGRAALWYSKAIVTGYFWPVLWRLFVVMVLPVNLMGWLLGKLPPNFESLSPLWLISVLASNAIYAFTVPLFSIAGVLLYNSLRKEKSTAKK